MGLFDGKVLDERKLKGFDNYKYNCIDSSPIAVYISHPFWNWFVNLLVDHGLDSFSTLPFTLTMFSLFGLGSFSPLRLLCVLISVQLVFIVAHWEKYNTGVLFLSWGYDASQYGLSILYLVAYFYGHEIFQYRISGIMLAVIFEMSFYVCCFISSIMSLYNLHHAYFVDGTGKQENFYEFILPMISPVLLFTLAICWAIYSPSKVNDASPRLFCWTMGVVFSNIAVNLIIDQMSITRATLLNKMLIVYGITVMMAISGMFGSAELIALKITAILFTSWHIGYGVAVIRQLCEHFKIFAFSLDYLKKRRHN